jgi:hypothetical protein
MKLKELRQIIREELNGSSVGNIFYEWEQEISDPETAEEEKESLMNLNSYSEAVNYYLNERGWRGDEDFMELLIDFLASNLDNK